MTPRAWHWTIGLIQLGIICAVGGWVIERVPNASFGAAGAIGFGAAYLLTMAPISLFYWYVDRRVARKERSRHRL